MGSLAETVSFPLLIDADLAVIRDYGIVNQDSPQVPHPTVVVVDRQGTVRFVHLDENYRRRPDPEVILDALRAIGDSDAGEGDTGDPSE